MHWDVDNENLHGAWFEETTRQHDLLAQMFRDVNQVDPNVKLFINDYMVLKGSISTVVSFAILNKIFINFDVFLKERVSRFSQTVSILLTEQAMKELAVQLINAEAPIYGVGIQSHIPYAGPSIHVLKVILDLFCAFSPKTLFPKNVKLTWFLRNI